jgi:hypothetical protein
LNRASHAAQLLLPRPSPPLTRPPGTPEQVGTFSLSPGGRGGKKARFRWSLGFSRSGADRLDATLGDRPFTGPSAPLSSGVRGGLRIRGARGLLTFHSRPLNRLAWASLPIILSGLAGCGRVLGPEAMPVAAVRGVVTEGNRRVGGGWIEFIPVDATIGKLRSARLNADGTFEATRVAVGVNLVRVVHARIESPVVAQVVGAFSSPIRRKVSPDDHQTFSIDLLEETLRFQASLSTRTGGRGTGAAKGAP